MEQAPAPPQPEKPQQCPYCLIGQGKIPALSVYDDSDFMAVLEIKPAVPGHIILFPKSHIDTISNFPDDKREKLFHILNLLTNALEKISGSSTIHIDSGKDANLMFDHLIINIIPRYPNDNIKFAWIPKPVMEDEMKKIQQAIKDALSQQPQQELPQKSQEEQKQEEQSLQDKLIKPEERIPSW